MHTDYHEQNIAKPLNALLQYRVSDAIDDLVANPTGSKEENTINAFLAMQNIPATLKDNNALELSKKQEIHFKLRGFTFGVGQEDRSRIHFVSDPNLNQFIVKVLGKVYEWDPQTDSITNPVGVTYEGNSMIYGILNNKHYVNYKGIKLTKATIGHPILWNNFILKPSFSLMLARTFNANLNLLEAVLAYTSPNDDEEIEKLLGNSYIQQLNFSLNLSVFYKSTIDNLLVAIHINHINAPSFQTVIENDTIDYPVAINTQIEYILKNNIISMTRFDITPQPLLIDNFYTFYLSQTLLWQPLPWLIAHLTMKQNFAALSEGLVLGGGIQVGETKRFLEFSVESSILAESYNPIYDWAPIFPRYAAFTLQAHIIW